jgi:hypothetical protein
MAFLIGLSRPYLGIHFPQDVLAGWVLGLLILFLWLRFEDRLAAWWHRQPTSWQVGISVAGPILLLLLMPADKAGHFPNEVGGTYAGLLIGAGLGSILEQRTVRFQVEGAWQRRLVRYLLGIILAAIIYAGGAFLPDLDPWLLNVVVRLARYGLLGLFVVWLAPWLFVKLRLANTAHKP